MHMKKERMEQKLKNGDAPQSGFEFADVDETVGLVGGDADSRKTYVTSQPNPNVSQ